MFLFQGRATDSGKWSASGEGWSLAASMFHVPLQRNLSMLVTCVLQPHLLGVQIGGHNAANLFTAYICLFCD